MVISIDDLRNSYLEKQQQKARAWKKKNPKHIGPPPPHISGFREFKHKGVLVEIEQVRKESDQI